MKSAIIQGDALEELARLPGNSVDCCVTSPPYYQLRDYGVNGQIGLEETVEEYIDRLVAVFREVKRVLRRDGTLWVNIADSYAGSGKGASKCPENALKYKQGTNKGLLGTKLKPTTKAGCKAKDLLGVPWLLALALRADGWYWRQVDIWEKPNCMPESVKDRRTTAHEYILLFSKSARYYFDYQAIEEPCTGGNNIPPAGSKGTLNNRNEGARLGVGERTVSSTGLRRKRSVWHVPILGSKYNHFATFPPRLVTPCVLAGSRAGGIVLDPFAGTGTVGKVARENGREYILIDLAPANVEICKSRLEDKK